MKKLTPTLVNLMLVAVIALAGTITVKTIEDIQYNRTQRAKAEYEYRYKETASVTVEDTEIRYNLWIYDRETGKIKHTSAVVYKYSRNGVDKRIDTKVMQGTPSIQ